MKKKILFPLMVMLLVSAITFASNVPQNVQAAFKKMYPSAYDTSWSTKSDYYVAEFSMNDLEKEVWFDNQADRLMTQTDLKSADLLSSAVYNAFTFGQYSTWQVEDVTLVEFPDRSPISVIEVEQNNNVAAEYQLFYSQNGELQHMRNITYSDNTLYPECFDY